MVTNKIHLKERFKRKDYYVQPPLGQEKNLSSSARNIFMFGIESRTSNYPRKLHRLCIHMRKYLAGHRKNKWRKYRKKTRSITRVHLLINISHSNSSIDNFKYSRSINTCLKLISRNILFNQEKVLSVHRYQLSHEAPLILHPHEGKQLTPETTTGSRRSNRNFREGRK